LDNVEEDVSTRLVEQRIRNRIMEIIGGLADGDVYVRTVGFSEYFEAFYDWIAHRDDGGMQSNSTISPDDFAVLGELSALLDDACNDTPRNMTDEEFISSGWPRRLQLGAEKALVLMRARGRCSEDEAEQAPSHTPASTSA
jgi:hypothetical protein